MAITGTRISDLVPSEKRLANTVDVLTRTTNELVNSGLTVSTPDTQLLMQGGPRKGFIPFVNPLDASEVNISSDDINELGSVGKLTGSEYSVVRHDLNYGWGYADLTRMVTLYDAKGGIDAGITAYWDAIMKRYAVSSIKGALAAGGAALKFGTSGTALSDATLIDAAASAEEQADRFNIMIVTPKTRAILQKAEKNTFVPASLTNTRFDTYQGYKLVISTVFGEGVTVLARDGALAFDIGTVPYEQGIEIERIANGGKGGGAEILHSRRSMVTHPQGFNYLGAVAPTTTILENAASWSLAVAAKFVPFRQIVHTAG